MIVEPLLTVTFGAVTSVEPAMFEPAFSVNVVTVGLPEPESTTEDEIDTFSA